MMWRLGCDGAFDHEVMCIMGKLLTEYALASTGTSGGYRHIHFLLYMIRSHHHSFTSVQELTILPGQKTLPTGSLSM